MKLNIGENIRQLRLKTTMTQEQLGNLLNVTGATISKWESGTSYPDITMVMPLAQIFNVSTDVLMGYEQGQTDIEIQKVLKDYDTLHLYGRFTEATALIANAKAIYPGDHRIINCYMWDLVGGKTHAKQEILEKEYSTLLELSDSILNSCKEETLRLNALEMKANVYYAQGKKELVSEIIAQIPSWGVSAEIINERLSINNSTEYHKTITRNLYRLADAAALKIVKKIWTDQKKPIRKRIEQCEAIGNCFSEFREKTEEAFAAIMEHTIFTTLFNSIIDEKTESEILLRVLSKRINAAKKLTEYAKQDSIFRELLVETYQTSQIDEWTKTI